uniref:Uncharacterized protein n=1 Tax=Cacopsylla melanoneura TaxID=428564 RepID=A0A8D8XCB4_9HEMI
MKQTPNHRPIMVTMKIGRHCKHYNGKQHQQTLYTAWIRTLNPAWTRTLLVPRPGTDKLFINNQVQAWIQQTCRNPLRTPTHVYGRTRTLSNPQPVLWNRNLLLHNQ